MQYDPSRLFFTDAKVVLVVDIDKPEDGDVGADSGRMERTPRNAGLL